MDVCVSIYASGVVTLLVGAYFWMLPCGPQRPPSLLLLRGYFSECCAGITKILTLPGKIYKLACAQRITNYCSLHLSNGSKRFDWMPAVLLTLVQNSSFLSKKSGRILIGYWALSEQMRLAALLALADVVTWLTDYCRRMLRLSPQTTKKIFHREQYSAACD